MVSCVYCRSEILLLVLAIICETHFSWQMQMQ